MSAPLDSTDSPALPVDAEERKSAVAPPRQLARSAVRGGAFLMAARFAVQLSTWAVTLLVARLLAVSDYGIMAWALLFVVLADLLAEAGVGRALVQKHELGPTDRDQAFTVSLCLAGLLYAALFLSADGLARELDVPGLGPLLRVMGLLLCLVPFRTVAAAILDREQRFGRQAAILVVSSLAQSALVLGLAWGGAGYWALAGGALLGRLAETVAVLLAAGWAPRLAWPGREARALVAFGLYASGSTFLWFAYSNADFAVVGRLLGEEALGAYSLAFQLASIPVQRLTANVNQIAYPVFCRLQHDRDRLRNWHQRLTVLLGFVAMPTLAGMALVAGDAFPLILGQKWLPAVLPFQMLSVVGIIMVFAATLPPLYNAIGRPDINLRYTAACAAVLPASFLLGGWLDGIQGVCLAWIVGYPLLVACLVLLTRPLTGIRLEGLILAQVPTLTAVAVMVTAVLTVQALLSQLMARLVIGIIVGAVFYTGTMLLVGRKTVLSDLWSLWRELRGGTSG